MSSNKIAFRLLHVLALCGFLLTSIATHALAQSQNKTQQGCINQMNKSGQKVLATQGKANSSCVKDAGANKLGGTAQACLTADPKNKLSKAQQKTVDGEAKKCTAAPAFAKTDSATVNAAAAGEELGLMEDVLANPLDGAIIDGDVDKDGASCQAAVVKATEKLTSTYAKTFNGCKKDELKNNASNEGQIAGCLGQDPKGKIGKTETKLADTPAKKCGGVDQTVAFPGACAGAASFPDCIDNIVARARCRTCQSISLQDGFAAPACDNDDDGIVNGSCRECGNSVTESPEGCDDGGESATCDSDCTAAVCGDGNVNATASEDCDDSGESATCDADCTDAICGDGTTNVTASEDCDDSGESATCDADCTTASCGDGTTNNTAGEDCDDSGESATCDIDCTSVLCGDGTQNATAGEACDDGGANSDVTPDACRTNCQLPSCGDGVTDSGEGCDDAGESATCDADCTPAACGDGTVNTTAGESCDDSGESATCDADCSPAACGDGTTNTTAGETCDDAGESATCDADCSAATCGDGTTNTTAGETCDDSGESATCDVNCTAASCGDGTLNTTSGEGCDNGGANSDVVPDACRTNCQPAGCGDGVTDTGEGCDDSGESATCDNDCSLAICGDGTTNTTAGEACDDAGESATCDVDCSAATCGDGTLNTTSGEICDDGGANSDVLPDACRTNCQAAGCGDGVTDSGEFCDDSGNSATCDADCTAAACGDGFTNPPAGETCDDSGESATCDDDCTSVVCSDSNLNETSGEECDDGNTTPGDGCNATCLCGPGSGEAGCQDELCPDKGEVVIYAGTSATSCSSNGDCAVGTCNTGIGLCQTETLLSTGWTGIAHGSDANDEVKQAANLICPGPFDGMAAEPCGECVVAGLIAETRDCRCAADNRTVCDEPFVADADDCGGGICNCYLGPPLPLSAGNTPACSINKFATDVTGTANVDLGEGEVTTSLKAIAYLGINLILPCPACGGTCTAPAGSIGAGCGTDLDCDSSAGAADGVCGNYDVTPKDGVRDGTCKGGLNDGESCDIDAYNSTFPAPGPSGSGMSLDCFPDPGKNVSGTGLNIALTQTTGTSALPVAGIECGFPPFVTYDCPCGQCSNDTSTACTSNADCSGGGTCGDDGSGKPLPDQCDTTLDCVDVGGGVGECGSGPVDTLCDGILRANGKGFIGCLANVDCEPGTIGVDAGACTLSETRPCFLDPVTASGVPSPTTPIGAASFCIPKTSNGGINTVAGLPGPAKIRNQVASTTYCASDNGTAYTPGVGGCP